MRNGRLTLLFAAVLFACGTYTCTAGEVIVVPDGPIAPLITDNDAYDVEVDDDAPEAPLEPAVSGKRRFKYGTILEYWFLNSGEIFSRMPADPCLSAMIDDSRQYFQGTAMARDGELRNYLNRQGVLQWTTYFRAVRPGKHVFVLSSAGMGVSPNSQQGTAYRGVSLLVNDAEKIHALPDRDYSATVEFSAPGWYKLQVRMWWSDPALPNFENYGAALKVREPGAMSLRPLNRKDLYYTQP